MPRSGKPILLIEQNHPEDNCLVQLIIGDRPNYYLTMKINIKERIIEQVTQEERLIVTTQPEEMFSKCQTDKYLKTEFQLQ